jgi:carbamoyl-phosphate synthase large subunit
MGGQTALNTALSLKKMGVLEKFGVEMIGADAEAIDKAEDRQLFREAMTKIGLDTPASRLANASALKKADREAYEAEIARIEALDVHPGDKKRMLAGFEFKWNAGENERRKRYQEHALGEALIALSEVGLPAIIRPPSRSAAPAAASPTTARNSSTSWSAASTPRRRTRSHRRERARLEGVRDGSGPR